MSERFVLSFGAGAACLSVLVFGLCALGWAQTPWLLASAAAVAVTLWYLRQPATPRAAVPVWFWIAAAPFAVVYLVNAAAPEISPDGAYYHLGLVRRYFNDGGFRRVTTDFHSNLTQGCEMLFLVAYAVGRHSAAALVHCAFLFALPAAMMAYGRRFGFEIAGMIAALLVFVAPVVGADGSSAYVDVALAFAGFASFYALQIWDAERTGRMLVYAGLLAGFCFAIKYTGVTAVLFAAGFVAWRARKLLPILIISASSALVAAPWMVKNWMSVSNPVSPFLNRLFPNPYIHVAFEDGLGEAMRHFNGFRLDARTPFELTLWGGQLQGTLGPAFLLTPLGLLAISDVQGRRVLSAALVTGLPWLSNAGTRFLVPALPFLALAIALAVARRPRAAIAIALLNALACWPWILGMYCAPYNWRITRFPILAALRAVPESEFLNQYAPEIRFARLLQERVPAGGVVYTAQPIMTAYTDRTIVLNFAAALNERLADVLAAAAFPPFQPSERVTFRFNAENAGGLRLLVTGSAPVWTIHEIEATPGNPRASVNNWDAAYAADDRLVTSWRSWQAVRPGMSFEVGIPASANVRALSYRTRPADPGPAVQLQVRTPNGEWRNSNAAPEHESGLPVPDLRAQAMDEFRRAGITHLLIHDAEPLGPDFQRNTAAWEVIPAGESLPVRLYRIIPRDPLTRRANSETIRSKSVF